MFEDVIDGEAIARLTENELNEILAILEKAGY
jgi:hypothetical protein